MILLLSTLGIYVILAIAYTIGHSNGYLEGRRTKK